MAWRSDPVRRIIRAMRKRPAASVVQIGSNDGTTWDPIRGLLLKYPSWKALLVEPVPFLFERLRANYAGRPLCQFENVAIADRVGSMSFFYIDASAKLTFPDLPSWFDQLGSFDRSHISRHFGDKLNQFVVTMEVPTISLSALLERNQIDTVNLLHIDTEGADWLILRQLDLMRYRPDVILFEHKHLTGDDRTSAQTFLAPHYSITDLGGDFFCRLR